VMTTGTHYAIRDALNKLMQHTDEVVGDIDTNTEVWAALRKYSNAMKEVEISEYARQ